jgi:hypothetical protein
MLLPLLFVVAGVALWLFIAPGLRFLPALARLLTSPQLEHNPFSVFTGRSYVTGQFQGRDVAVRLQQRRGRYQLGYLVIAVRTAGVPTLDYNGIDARIQDDTGRAALFTIAARDLLLTVEDGWLKTMWKPMGFATFPGHFAEEVWRPILDAMRTIASSLETAS